MRAAITRSGPPLWQECEVCRAARGQGPRWAGSPMGGGGSHEARQPEPPVQIKPDPMISETVGRNDDTPRETFESTGNRHERLYAWRAWIAIVRDVLLILLLLAFAFVGGRPWSS